MQIEKKMITNRVKNRGFLQKIFAIFIIPTHIILAACAASAGLALLPVGR